VSARATHADSRAADAAARLAAQTVFGVPLVLVAGAGTGKTTVLVARVLAWCLGPGWDRAERALLAADPATPAARAVAERTLERVVAITFTEAAAAEMEARAMTGLAQVGAGKAVLGLDADVAPAEASARRERARMLLAGFDRLHVQTIHAFCRRLLANHPLEAGVHPRFTVDARGAERNAAAREALEERLRAMAEHDDADLEALLLHGVGAPELAGMLDALLAAAVPAEAFAADPLGAERVREFVERMRAASDALNAALGERMAGLGAKSIGNAIAGAAVATSARLVSGAASRTELAALLGDLAELWPKNRLDRLGEWGRSKWKTKSEQQAVLGAAEPVEAAASALHSLLSNALAIDVEVLALVHRALAPLLASAVQRLHEVGAESFDGLLRTTRDLLVARPDVAERVRRDIDQLLVDEFQDTDALQCEIVAALALGGDTSARPGLFLVGDPKQSVYGWRNADIGAYMDFVARVLAEPGAVEHGLCVNYRSVPAVLDEVERVIEPAMHFAHGLQPAFEPLLPCEKHAGVVGSGTPGLPAVEYWVSAAWDAEAGALARSTPVQQAARLEARHLAHELRHLHENGVAWKDVALLFRSTGDLDEYLGALRDAGIPYTVDRDRDFYRRREVMEAAALVRAVLDPSDQIAQVAVLRSAWVGVPDAAWRTLWDEKFPDAVRDALDGRDGARGRLREIAAVAARATADLDVPGLASLAGWEANLLHALEVLVALRRSWLGEPIDRFIEKLRVLPLLEATEAARYPGAFRLANLARFFRELAASLEADDVATVLRTLRRDAASGAESYQGRPRDPAEDAVQVMTIHGAKGLDFAHVYVLQLHKGSGAGSKDPLVHAEIGGRLEWGLAPGRGSLVASLGYDRVRARREQVQAAELVRTLYVALTRTKVRLVMAGCLDANRHPATHASFVLDVRGDALRDAAAQVGAALEAGTETHGIAADVDGARVVFLGAARVAASEARETAGGFALTAARVQGDAQRLREESRIAALRQQRSFGGRASEKVPDALREARVGGGDGEPEADARETHRDAIPPEMEVAAAVGTAIHALLERFDWDADPAAEWARQRAWLQASLARRVSRSRLDAAGERAESLLERLEAGPLWSRLRNLTPHVLARELPVLVRAEEDGAGAIAYVVGAIDLVYRDPASGEVVVVDFKTDRIATRGAIADRVAHHRPQAEQYRRAVLEALRLPQAPRFELWFLDASRVEVVEFEPAPGEARA
jgi:ATP-dependent helicase/nuclease subunit A